MDITEAIDRRKSIRAFKGDPVPQVILKEIIELSLRAPSWANTQPWEIAIATGNKLEEIKRLFLERLDSDPAQDIARPEKFPEPFDTRRRALAAKLLELRGIARDDKQQRDRWRAQGLKNFDAPCVIYLCIDRSFYFQANLNAWPIFDCGLLAENIMLLAPAYGLGTIPQAQAVFFPDILRKVLSLPDSKLVVVGISIGYPDWDSPVNKYRSERDTLDKVVNWYGFTNS